MLQDDGQYVMYYSAALKGLPDKHCLGVALSSNPVGPFQPIGDTPLLCPNHIRHVGGAGLIYPQSCVTYK